MKRLIVLGTFIALGLIVFFICQTQVTKQMRHKSARFPAARTVQEGEVWLNWDVSMRVGFTNGFVQGFRRGARNGCSTATQILKPISESTKESVKDPESRCVNDVLSFTKGASYYESELTAYYKRHPEDQDVLIEQLLQLLSDSSTENLEQFHERLSRRDP
jgi:hypothetical protein